LLPEQALELVRVVGAEPAPEDELLRRRHGRDRVELEEADAPDGVEDARRGAVEELGANGDAPRLFLTDEPHRASRATAQLGTRPARISAIRALSMFPPETMQTIRSPSTRPASAAATVSA